MRQVGIDGLSASGSKGMSRLLRLSLTEKRASARVLLAVGVMSFTKPVDSLAGHGELDPMVGLAGPDHQADAHVCHPAPSGPRWTTFPLATNSFQGALVQLTDLLRNHLHPAVAIDHSRRITLAGIVGTTTTGGCSRIHGSIASTAGLFGLRTCHAPVRHRRTVRAARDA